MHIHVHVHHEPPQSALEAKLDTLIALQKEIAVKIDDINEKLANIDTATNEIAEDIAKLKEQIAGGLTAAEAETVNAALGGIQDRLRAVAAGQ